MSDQCLTEFPFNTTEHILKKSSKYQNELALFYRNSMSLYSTIATNKVKKVFFYF